MTELLPQIAVALSLAAEAGAGPDPVGHVVNHKGPWGLGWVWSAQIGTLALSGIICILGFRWIAAHIETGPESDGAGRYVTGNRLAHMVEVICVYLRDKVIAPLLHERTRRFLPFLWTLFFFILINNLLGLVPILDAMYVIGEVLGQDWKKQHVAPIGGTATQNLAVTGVLATFSFIVINAAGVRELGVKGYLMHLPGGAPPDIWPILVPVEILGTLNKPLALAVRLFANMTAGHILLATLFAFIGMAFAAIETIGGVAGLGVGVGVIAMSAIGAFAIYLLEIFVATLQAFVFMFLTTVFISQLSHHGEHHDEEHDHAGGETPALAT